MPSEPSSAKINVHLLARVEDKVIIDHVAGLIGSNRSQFMLASALKEAKNILLDQSTIRVGSKQFNAIMDWLDKAPSAEAKKGMKHLSQTKVPW
jgi:uncharacterized protein (DUF1778 family)